NLTVALAVVVVGWSQGLTIIEGELISGWAYQLTCLWSPCQQFQLKHLTEVSVRHQLVWPLFSLKHVVLSKQAKQCQAPLGLLLLHLRELKRQGSSQVCQLLLQLLREDSHCQGQLVMGMKLLVGKIVTEFLLELFKGQQTGVTFSLA
ncbi:hypothetical protein CFP56_003438, partial [Quercus suber]